ncbi:MAG TPA: biotin--[acetyl-CoA-carboxylase] ligase [Rhodopila sp.]
MNVILHEELGSTSDEARRLAQGGAPHGTVVVARRQTAGRGRLGRVWVSPVGNLYASFLLRPGVAAARVPEIGFIAAVSVADAVDAALAAAAAALKWPNDVQIAGAKVAGILVEAESDGVVIVGTGVNVGFAPLDLPYPVTSLAAHGSAATVDAVLQALAAAFERHLAAWSAAGFGPVREAWLRRGPALGQAVQLRTGQQGDFAGLDADGALLLATPAGVRRVVVGEVT